MQTPEEFVKSNDPDKILTFDEIDDRIKLIRARDSEWQARVDKLEAALRLYADSDNWELDDEHNTFRRWLEPGSYTPCAYNGFSIARAALGRG